MIDGTQLMVEPAGGPGLVLAAVRLLLADYGVPTREARSRYQVSLNAGTDT
jgi:hypothetical protein